MERHLLLHYIEVGGTFELIGEGFEDLTENNSVNSKSKRYIHDSAPRQSAGTYTTEYSLSGERVEGDKANDYFHKIGLFKLTNEESKSKLVSVFMTKKESTGEKEYKAVQVPVSVVVENSGTGTSEDGLKMSVKLLADGSVKKGKFDLTSKTFTEKEWA